MNPTMFDPISLESWNSDETSSQFLQSKLENYLQNYFPCFYPKPQRNLFQTFVRGLLSPLERRSIEPIALHFSGEKYVRPLQQFFSRSPFDERPLLETYQELLSTQINAPGGMLSVDDTSFVKKGRHSAGVKRQYCGRLGKTENCQSGIFLVMPGIMDTASWITSCIFPRYGLVSLSPDSEKNAISQKSWSFLPKMKSGSD